jgi:hypothetical protein
VATGRKQKACLLKKNLGETLETHLTGKTIKKRQNFESSTPPACTEHLHFMLNCTEHLHFMLNGETRKAPGLPPDSSVQTAWEDTDHKVS